MFDYRGLAALQAVLETGSFDKASLRLYITQSAVSQRIKQLESSMGQSLLVRSNPVEATTAGKLLLKHIKQVQLLETDVQRTLNPRSKSGWHTLSLAVNADSLATWFLTDLAPWCKKQQLLLDLRIDDQDQTLELLKKGEVVACISSASTALQGCECSHLHDARYICIASPQYVEEYFNRGFDRDSFSKAPYVRFNQKDLLQHQFLKQYFDLNADQIPHHLVPSPQNYIEMIKAGLGFGMAPSVQIKQELMGGTLVEVLPDKQITLSLYWHTWGVKTDLIKGLSQQIISSAIKL